MFNLLKKSKAVVKSLTETPASIARTVEKIHYEFDSAAERLLNEAKAIIAKGDTSLISKAERLSKLGFTISKPVTESAAQVRQQQESKKVAEAIVYYQQWYPLNKFITEKEVKAICEKYGLMFGDAKIYKGDIPEKNIAEIEAFKLREEDMQDGFDVRYDGNGRSWYEQDEPSMWAQQIPLRSSLMQSGLGNLDWQRRTLNALAQSRPSYTAIPNGTKQKPTFKICAPVKDFDTRYMEVKDGYKLEYDPIVLQPVNHGFLIVSKWGLPEEANKELINPIQN